MSKKIVVDEKKREQWSASEFDPSKLSENESYGLLWWHILEKGYQAGAVLSIPISLAIGYFKKDSPLIGPNLLGRIGVGSLAGVAAVGALGVASTRKYESRDEVDDRVYRLHYNEGQNRTDYFSAVGALVGIGFAAGTGLARTPARLLGGAAVGSAAGILAHVATFKPTNNQSKLPNASLMISEMDPTKKN